MNKLREEFEKLPEIAERLHTVIYNEDLNQYHAAMINSGLSVRYIQGAWYAYQEQQKILDAYKLILKTQIGFDIVNSILDQSKASENQNISPDCQNGIISKGEFLVSGKNSDSGQSKEVSINISKDGKITKTGD